MGKLWIAFEIAKKHGVLYLVKRILFKIRQGRIPNFSYVSTLFRAKNGLEVGGPSGVFKNGGFVPIYKVINELDGCNFSNSTLWEGTIESGRNYYYYEGKSGTQFILEATDLNNIANEKYDFIISSNCLEHVANPLKAMQEWIRVIKNNGIILLVLPNKKYCFDHRRPTTTFAHILADFQNNTREDDLTHLDEILELHDLAMDKPAGNKEQFRARSLKNFENRALHHHVFSMSLLEEIFNYFGLEILLSHEGRELIIIGKKAIV